MAKKLTKAAREAAAKKAAAKKAAAKKAAAKKAAAKIPTAKEIAKVIPDDIMLPEPIFLSQTKIKYKYADEVAKFSDDHIQKVATQFNITEEQVRENAKLGGTCLKILQTLKRGSK